MWVINWSSPVTQKTFHGSSLAWCCQWKKNKCPTKRDQEQEEAGKAEAIFSRARNYLLRKHERWRKRSKTSRLSRLLSPTPSINNSTNLFHRHATSWQFTKCRSTFSSTLMFIKVNDWKLNSISISYGSTFSVKATVRCRTSKAAWTASSTCTTRRLTF